MAEKKTYRVRPGQVFGAKSHYAEGDTIELTESEAAAFADKLEPVLILAASEKIDPIPEEDEMEDDPPLFASLSESIARALFDAGYKHDEHVADSSDDELLALDGIGPIAIRKIRELYRGY